MSLARSDPVFFDPDADVPREIEHDALERTMVEVMSRAGVRPEIIYAFEKTGLLLTRDNESFVSPRDRAEFNAAIDEYFRLEAESHSGRAH